MFKITGLRSWNFNATGLDATADFYTRGLGATESGRQTIGGASVIRLRVGDYGLGLFDAANGPRPGIPHHTFLCEGPADPDDMKADLAARGIEVESVRIEGDGPRYSVYVVDPSGNRLELSVTPVS